jgi:hypothetical protein
MEFTLIRPSAIKTFTKPVRASYHNCFSVERSSSVYIAIAPTGYAVMNC